MCELASAAYYMEIEPLIDLTCKVIRSTHHHNQSLLVTVVGSLILDWYPSRLSRAALIGAAQRRYETPSVYPMILQDIPNPDLSLLLYANPMLTLIGSHH